MLLSLISDGAGLLGELGCTLGTTPSKWLDADGQVSSAELSPGEVDEFVLGVAGPAVGMGVASEWPPAATPSVDSIRANITNTAAVNAAAITVPANVIHAAVMVTAERRERFFLAVPVKGHLPYQV